MHGHVCLYRRDASASPKTFLGCWKSYPGVDQRQRSHYQTLYCMCSVPYKWRRRSDLTVVRWPCRLRMSCWVIKMLVNCPSRGSTSGAADDGVRGAASAAAGDCGPHGVGADGVGIYEAGRTPLVVRHQLPSPLDVTPGRRHSRRHALPLLGFELLSLQTDPCTCRGFAGDLPCCVTQQCCLSG